VAFSIYPLLYTKYVIKRAFSWNGKCNKISLKIKLKKWGCDMRKIKTTVYLILLLAISLFLANCATANDPVEPTVTESPLVVETFFETDVYATEIAMYDSIAFVTQGNNGVAIFDMFADSVVAETPSEINYAADIDVIKETKRLYVHDSQGGPALIRVYNLENPTSPQLAPPLLGQTQGIDVVEAYNINETNDLIVYSRNNAEETDVYFAGWDGFNFAQGTGPVQGVFARGILGLDYKDGNVYVTNGQYGIRVIDRNEATIVADIDVPGSAMAVKVVDNHMIVACKEEGLIIFDITNPNAPLEVYYQDTSGYAQNLAIEGDLMAVASGGGGVYVYDISSLAAPVYLGRVDDAEIGYTYDVEISDGKIFTASKRGVAKIALNLD